MSYSFDLTELEFRLLRDFIHQEYGLYFKDEKRSFIRMKLYPRVEGLGLGSFGEYLNLIKYGESGRQEQSWMLAAITNNETYFYRELPQLRVFSEVLLSELRDRKLAQGERRLRVLSAGCSTGEEVYTLAMLTYETGAFFWDWDVQIIGLDLSETAIAIAQRGVYYPRSFRMSDPEAVKKFFAANSGDFIAKDNVKRMTAFRHGNLLDPAAWQPMPEFDVILCRNVLIYFSEPKVKQALELFHRALRPGGHLLLGHSETLTGIPNSFEPRRFPEAIIYRKKEPSPPDASAPEPETAAPAPDRAQTGSDRPPED